MNSEIDPLFERLTLLVIDMQPAFLNAITWHSNYLARTRFAIAAAQLLGIRVVFTEQVPQKLGNTEASLLAAAGGNSAIFPKTTFSALAAEGLIDHLHEHSVEHLLIAGIELPICIYQTCMDAVNHELDATVLTDCVAARRPEDAASVLDTLRSHSISCLPSETIFYSMLGDIHHAAFKPFTQLVKNA